MYLSNKTIRSLPKKIGPKPTSKTLNYQFCTLTEIKFCEKNVTEYSVL